jgi:hypothetical protein
MTIPSPRNPAAKRRFGELLGRGVTVREAALAVGISHKTGFRWAKLPEVAAITKDTREALLSPGVKTVLREALTAMKRDGTPDHAIRLQAAKLMILEPDAAPPSSDDEDELPEGTIVLLPEPGDEQP